MVGPIFYFKFALKMEQIERIRQMELRMERAAKAVMELSAALDNYEAPQGNLQRSYNCYH